MGYLFNDIVENAPSEFDAAMDWQRYYRFLANDPQRLPPLNSRASAFGAGFVRPRRRSLEDHQLTAQADRDPRFNFIEGDFGQILVKHPELEGTFAIAFENYGILKYSHFERALRIYLRLLKLGGRLYFSSPGVTIYRNDGIPVSLAKYLRAIEGVSAQVRRNPATPIDSRRSSWASSR